MPTYHPLTLATALTLFTACDPAPQGADDETHLRCVGLGNGCSGIGNTPFTGSLNLSPLDTQGNMLEDIVVEKVTVLGSVVLEEFWADEGELIGYADNVYYDGTDFADAVFSLTAWGEPIALRIVAADQPPLGEKFWLYMFEWDNGPGGTDPVCLPANGDLRAIVHDDIVIDPDTGAVTTRPNTVYIACLRGAAGEAAYRPLGYGFRPFQQGRAAFEAAMYFLRADYCAEGKSWTTYGQPISYSDKWGVSAAPPVGHTDAVWGLHGALCIGDSLRDGNTYEDIICETVAKPPRCSSLDVKALYQTQGRIWSKIP